MLFLFQAALKIEAALEFPFDTLLIKLWKLRSDCGTGHLAFHLEQPEPLEKPLIWRHLARPTDPIPENRVFGRRLWAR